MVKAGWRELGWGSDAALLVWAPSLEELLVQGAGAIVGFSLAESEPTSRARGPKLSLEAPDTVELFIDWLTEVNYRLQVDRWVVVDPAFVALTDTSLTAWLDGYPLHPARTRFRHEVKAITRHSPFLRRAPDGTWVARVTLDL